MISLKSGVVIDHRTHPMMFVALFIVNAVLESTYGVKECVVTSGNDSKHMKGSLHYNGCAFDFRSKNWPVKDKDMIVKEIKVSLGTDYDVLLEGVGTPNEHLHVEYDPK